MTHVLAHAVVLEIYVLAKANHRELTKDPGTAVDIVALYRPLIVYP
jgi:hypothetical protein